MDGSLPRRGPFGPPPPDFYPLRGQGALPMMPSKQHFIGYDPWMLYVILTLCVFLQCGPHHPQEWSSLLVFLQADLLFLHLFLLVPPLFDSLPPPSVAPLPPQQTIPLSQHHQVSQGRTPQPEGATWAWACLLERWDIWGDSWSSSFFEGSVLIRIMCLMKSEKPTSFLHFARLIYTSMFLVFYFFLNCYSCSSPLSASHDLCEEHPAAAESVSSSWALLWDFRGRSKAA